MLKARSIFVPLLCAAIFGFAAQLFLRAQPQADAQKAAALFKDAKKNLKNGEYAKALKAAEELLLIEPDYALAYLLKGQAQIGLFADEYAKAYQPREDKARSSEVFIPIKQAVENFEKYLSLTPQAKDAKHWRQELQFLRPFVEVTEKGNPQRAFYLQSEIPATKARILQRPYPRYPEAARRARATGKIVLLAVLSADGTVKNIFTLNQLSHGLTESSVEAARKIKFEAATKDGRPVSEVVSVVYTFQIY